MCNASPGTCSNHQFGPCMNISRSGTRKGDTSTTSTLPGVEHYQAVLLLFFLFNPTNLKILCIGHPGFAKRAMFLPKLTFRVFSQGDHARALTFSGQEGSCIQSCLFLPELSKHEHPVCWRQAEEPCHFDYSAARPILGTSSHHSKFVRNVEKRRCNLRSLLGLRPERDQ